MSLISHYSFVCPHFIGRLPQLGLLIQFFRQTTDKHGKIALLAGEAGIGKTRLIAELKKHVQADAATKPGQGFTILEGHCLEMDIASPYAPLLDVLMDLLPQSQFEHALSALIQHAPLLTELLPPLVERFPEVHPVRANLHTEPNVDKRHLHYALHQFLATATDVGPLLFIMEDMHWCDEASLEFLQYMTKHLTSLPICMILTYRTDDASPQLKRFLWELSRERLMAEIPLLPFTLTEVDNMIRSILNHSPGLADLPLRKMVEIIYELSEGNPFFVEEMLKTLVEETLGSEKPLDKTLPGNIPIPRTIQMVIERRLDQVGEATRKTLTLAAVIGYQFDVELLQQVSGQDETLLLEHLRTLIKAQLIVEESADKFAFRHALTRQAVYSDLLTRERQALHLAIGQALEGPSYPNDSRQLAILSYHFYHAGAWSQVAQYAPQAGENAQALYSPKAAIDYFTWAINAMQKLDQSPPISLWRARGQANETVGAFEAAFSDYQHALNTAQQVHNKVAQWQCLLDLGFLLTGRDYKLAGEYLAQALDCARTIEDNRRVAETLNRIGNWNMMLDRTKQGLEYHQEALQIFQTVRDLAGEGSTYDLLGVANYICGNMPQAATYYEEAIQRFRATNNRVGLASSLAVYAVRGVNYICYTTAYPAVSMDACLRDSETAYRIAQEIDWRAGEASALMYQSMGLGPRGAYGKALNAAITALTIASEIDHLVWTASANMAIGLIHLDLLSPVSAQLYLETALMQARTIGAWFMINSLIGQTAMCYMQQNRLAQAETMLQSTLGLDLNQATFTQDELQSQGQYTAWWAKAELELVRGHAERALLISQRIIEHQHVTRGAHTLAPRWLYVRGRAFTAINQPHEAEATLCAACDSARELGMSPLIWRIMLSLGRLYQSQGKRKLARDAFDEGRQLAQELAQGLTETALRQVFLTQLERQFPPIHSPTPRQAAKISFDGLSPRECEVAVLVAQGKTTLEISLELVLSERTVEKHVENILSKLAFHSRTQIAVWVAEKGLLPPLR